MFPAFFSSIMGKMSCVLLIVGLHFLTVHTLFCVAFYVVVDDGLAVFVSAKITFHVAHVHTIDVAEVKSITGKDRPLAGGLVFKPCGELRVVNTSEIHGYILQRHFF